MSVSTTSGVKLVWLKEAEGGPTFAERFFEGAMLEAVVLIREMALEADFLMGQLLRADGLVVATVAPGGLTHINKDSQEQDFSA